MTNPYEPTELDIEAAPRQKTRIGLLVVLAFAGLFAAFLMIFFIQFWMRLLERSA